MRIEPEIGGCSIILLGHFNPQIFVPMWFAHNKIISEEQANQAVTSVVHPQIAVCQIGKIQIQVQLDRFAAETSEASWIDLADFTRRTFGLLLHTPINQMGINRFVHFSVGSEEARNRIGNRLAPLDPWGRWGVEMAKNMNGRHGGFLNLIMYQPKPPGPITGHVQVQVEPSTRIKANAGIFVHVNDHYLSEPIEKTIGCEPIMAELAENFDASIQRSEDLIDQVMSLKEGQ
jgi:hypothetical protein